MDDDGLYHKTETFKIMLTEDGKRMLLESQPAVWEEIVEPTGEWAKTSEGG